MTSWSTPMPPLPPESRPQPDPGWRASVAQAPRALRPVVVLLLVNLALSIVLTVVVVIARNRIVDFQLDARHITDPVARETVRRGQVIGVIGRVVGNIVASVVYVYLVRALLRGRRWAYRRVVLLGVLGIVGLVLLQATPYPWWVRVEQILQALVLAALVYFVTRPEVRAHFDPALPGRDVGRFGRSRRGRRFTR